MDPSDHRRTQHLDPSMADANHSHEHGDGGRCDSHDQSHFLVVAHGLQGHLNPARAFARRLARVPGVARVTLSVTASAHGRMFPSLLGSPDEDEASDGLISYMPFSDGLEFGTRPRTADERARCLRASAESLSAIVRRLAVAGRPVTCVVSTISLPAMDVALEHGIPFAFFWIQTATAFAAYHHYFHGHEQLVASHVDDPAYEVSLPGLRPLRIGDLPSFLVDSTGSEHSKASIGWMRAIFEHVGREKPRVLVNTLGMLETTALQAMRQHLDVTAVGPMVPHLQQTDATEEDRVHLHLYKQDEKGYMEWLDAQPDRSVVYMSYGSMLTYDRQQVEEIMQGLHECRRPYLWVVRKDGRGEEVERILSENCSFDHQGVIVEWCDQLEVLSHPSVGCFVTHCGWNSTLEAVALGVPMITVPNWSDQALNARLVEEWGIGVRAKCNDKGVLVGTELAKCVEIVLGGGDEARSLREKARALKDTVQKDVTEGGLVESSLQNFVAAMQNLRSRAAGLLSA